MAHLNRCLGQQSSLDMYFNHIHMATLFLLIAICSLIDHEHFCHGALHTESRLKKIVTDAQVRYHVMTHVQLAVQVEELLKK